jgi:hypothetical protein
MSVKETEKNQRKRKRKKRLPKISHYKIWKDEGKILVAGVEGAPTVRQSDVDPFWLELSDDVAVISGSE